MRSEQAAAVSITGPMAPGYEAILSEAALECVAGITRTFRPRVRELLTARAERQRRIDAGELPDFAGETRDIRQGDWRVVEAPPGLRDRRLEFGSPIGPDGTGAAGEPGGAVFVADFEDALSPTWDNVIRSQINLRDASAQGRGTAILCPRGWHRVEPRILVDDEPATAALVDVVLYLFHNAAVLHERGAMPYLCLPKLESRHEAALWTDVVRGCEDCGIVGESGLRVIALIETVAAAFESEEILHELRDCAVGLGCDRRDYLFSFVKTFRRYAEFVLPDETELTTKTHMLHSYARLVADSCRQRGAIAFCESAQADEVDEPGAESAVSAADLLQVVKGRITEQGVRRNIRLSIGYLAAWFGGHGCVEIDGETADTAAAELARVQLWQWVHHETGILDEGTNVTADYVGGLLAEELDRSRQSVGDDAVERGHYDEAGRLLEALVRAGTLAPYLSLAAGDAPA